ncbi:MAG: type II toxin-antitoxin system prevent-host-death family antitoxin [Deltaproteobacteria bacterium]|nr:type II toxin-antitoxin system prevent-host-death family antitoxin [Deltaproteobacteria bacterium]
MGRWKISEAKAKFTALLESCRKGPQIICNRERPVAVVIDVKLFDEVMELRKTQEKPSIAELLQELQSIQQSETSEIEMPPRQDRPNSIQEASDEMAL